MGQIVVVTGDATARAVVGSCIALSLFHASNKTLALAHIVLPSSSDRSGPPGKFADTAIPFMIDALARHGALPKDLVAKMVGGASMFSTSGPLQIGIANQQRVVELLEELHIPLAGRHVGGTKGRRITCNPANGAVTVELVGQPPIVL